MFAGPDLNAFMRLGEAGLGNGARADRRQPRRGARAGRPARAGGAAAPVRRRGLRRLLLVARARHQPRPSVQARIRAAPAQLAPAARRLPRPRRHCRRQRHARAAAMRAVAAARRPRSPRSGRPGGSTSRSSWASSSACRAGWGNRCRWRRSPTTSSAWWSSTTGRRATCRRGSTSRWGPFLGKSFATSVSAWVTPLAVLEPARVAAPAQEPPPLAYLDGGRDWGLDVDLELELNGTVVSRTNARRAVLDDAAAARARDGQRRVRAYRRPDGDRDDQRARARLEGSLIELTRNGAEPLELPGGERTFLEDGDEVVCAGARARSSWARFAAASSPRFVELVPRLRSTLRPWRDGSSSAWTAPSSASGAAPGRSKRPGCGRRRSSQSTRGRSYRRRRSPSRA